MVLFASPDWGGDGLGCFIVGATGALLLATLAACAWFYFWLVNGKPAREFSRLLSGGVDVQIERLEIAGLGKSFDLNDSVATSYLTERFRSAEPRAVEFGGRFTGRIHFSTGRSIQCAIDIPQDKGYFRVHFPIDTLDEKSVYTIWLPGPIPESLTYALANLRDYSNSGLFREGEPPAKPRTASKSGAFQEGEPPAS